MKLKCDFGGFPFYADGLIMKGSVSVQWPSWWGWGGGSTHHLYNLPVVPDGTTQNHTEDHPYDLKSDTFLGHVKTFMELQAM